MRLRVALMLRLADGSAALIHESGMPSQLFSWPAPAALVSLRPPRVSASGLNDLSLLRFSRFSFSIHNSDATRILVHNEFRIRRW